MNAVIDRGSFPERTHSAAENMGFESETEIGMWIALLLLKYVKEDVP